MQYPLNETRAPFAKVWSHFLVLPLPCPLLNLWFYTYVPVVMQWVEIVQEGDALLIDPWYNNSNAQYIKRVYEAAFPPSRAGTARTMSINLGGTLPYENPSPSGCMPGEVVAALSGVDGQFCSPSCSATIPCPTNPCEWSHYNALLIYGNRLIRHVLQAIRTNPSFIAHPQTLINRGTSRPLLSVFCSTPMRPPRLAAHCNAILPVTGPVRPTLPVNP